MWAKDFTVSTIKDHCNQTLHDKLGVCGACARSWRRAGDSHASKTNTWRGLGLREERRTSLKRIPLSDSPNFAWSFATM